jgi:hypothetical protein
MNRLERQVARLVGVTHRYGKVVALDDITLHVPVCRPAERMRERRRLAALGILLLLGRRLRRRPRYRMLA